MTWLNYEWLGYVATPEEAIKLIKQTGQFYIVIAVAYFASFLYMVWHSSTAMKTKRNHGLTILMWGFIGVCLTLYPLSFSLFFNSVVTAVCLLVLYQLQFTSLLAAQAGLTASETETDNKKVMYAQTLLKKMNYTTGDVIGVSLINEQILWLMIFYRAVITLRASWEF
jgi:peptidoglycan/LPS O-acetylase OafA/YrhL